LGALLLLHRKGLATIIFLPDGLKRCQQCPLLVESLLVTKVVKVSIVTKVDDALGLGAQGAKGFPRLSKDPLASAISALATWILAMVDDGGGRWCDLRDTRSPSMATAMRADAYVASPMPSR
jgi:hypothetical protein